MTSLTLRRDAELKYDGPIPIEVLAHIAAQEQIEREAKITAGMTPEQLIRFHAAREFRLAKRAFRQLCTLTRRRTVQRPDKAWFHLRDQARTEANRHFDAWRGLRWEEQRAEWSA